MINLFKSKTHPIIGYSYAVTTGTYVGEILVFIEETEEDLKFISIPKNINRTIPKEKFTLGLNQKIVEVVEQMPKSVFKLLKKQFEFNTKINK
jgi:hypothetical protein